MHVKSITSKAACLALLSCLSGCGNGQRKTVFENISIQDTINAPIVILHYNQKNIGPFRSSPKTSIVFYTIQGCAACDEIYPFYKKMARKYNGKLLQFGKEDAILNRRHDPKIQEDSIYYYPTICIYKQGKLINKGKVAI